MHVSETALDFETRDTLTFGQQGEQFVALLSGGLYLPRLDMLFIADLHLEKGSAFAMRGQFLPPYDSHQSLKQLSADIDRLDPAHVICLGDSFHDVGGPERLPDDCRQLLVRLMEGRQWSWICGNHDPDLTGLVGGDVAAQMTLAGVEGSIGLTHEPGSLIASDCGIHGGAVGNWALELSGHLHPVASLASRQRGRALRRKTFVITSNRIILPAYGSYTGGLSIQDAAFVPFLDAGSRLVVLGRQTVCLCDAQRALPQRGRARRA